MTAYCEFASWADDGGTMADPRASANSDSAIPRNTLVDNWYRDIFVRVVVVDQNDRLRNDHVTFQVDSILSRYNTPEAYVAVVLKHNYGLARGVLSGDTEPRVLFQAY